MATKTKKPLLTIALKGKSIWMDTKGLKCKVSDYEFNGFRHGKKNEYCNLKVYHNLSWGIYTDETFEEVITKFLQKKHPDMKIKSVAFTEQGMQEDKTADMYVSF